MAPQVGEQRPVSRERPVPQRCASRGGSELRAGTWHRRGPATHRGAARPGAGLELGGSWPSVSSSQQSAGTCWRAPALRKKIAFLFSFVFISHPPHPLRGSSSLFGKYTESFSQLPQVLLWGIQEGDSGAF